MTEDEFVGHMADRLIERRHVLTLEEAKKVADWYFGWMTSDGQGGGHTDFSTRLTVRDAQAWADAGIQHKEWVDAEC